LKGDDPSLVGIVMGRGCPTFFEKNAIMGKGGIIPNPEGKNSAKNGNKKIRPRWVIGMLKSEKARENYINLKSVRGLALRLPKLKPALLDASSRPAKPGWFDSGESCPKIKNTGGES